MDKRIGYCIFCKRSDVELTDEHAIPLSLTPREAPGQVLRDASCKDCAAITGGFERTVFRLVAQAIRAGLGLRTRRRYPTVFPIAVWRGTEHAIVDVPLEDALRILPLPHFRPPGVLTTRPDPNALVADGTGVLYYGRSMQDIANQHGADKVGIPGIITIDIAGDDVEYGERFQEYGIAFARMIAKIGHCYAFAKFPLNGLDEEYVLPAIRGDTTRIGMWVGCEEPPVLEANGSAWTLRPQLRDGVFWLRLRIGAIHQDVPEYIIAVGHLKPEYLGLLQSIGMIRDGSHSNAPGFDTIEIEPRH